jgi:hypothetical protein
MKQNLLGLPLSGVSWLSILLGLAPPILHAIGAQWPNFLPITDVLAKVIEKIITGGLPIDPTVGSSSLILAGATGLLKTDLKK